MDVQGIFVVVGLIILSFWTIPFIRYRIAKRRSHRWPTVLARIETSQILRGGPTRYQALLYRSLVGYSYSVAGVRYPGLFVLIADDQATAENLGKQLVGRDVTACYNPSRPEVSLLVESELMGRQVIQNPLWLA